MNYYNVIEMFFRYGISNEDIAKFTGMKLTEVVAIIAQELVNIEEQIRLEVLEVKPRELKKNRQFLTGMKLLEAKITGAKPLFKVG